MHKKDVINIKYTKVNTTDMNDIFLLRMLFVAYAVKNMTILSEHGINAGTYVSYVRGILISWYISCFDLSYGYQLLVIAPKQALIVYI